MSEFTIPPAHSEQIHRLHDQSLRYKNGYKSEKIVIVETGNANYLMNLCKGSLSGESFGVYCCRQTNLWLKATGHNRMKPLLVNQKEALQQQLEALSDALQLLELIEVVVLGDNNQEKSALGLFTPHLGPTLEYMVKKLPDRDSIFDTWILSIYTYAFKLALSYLDKNFVMTDGNPGNITLLISGQTAKPYLIDWTNATDQPYAKLKQRMERSFEEEIEKLKLNVNMSQI